jgi:superfamily II DNA or RNA helicase
MILVPTNNYQRQWVRELCFRRGVFQLAPEVVFAGTVADMRRLQRRSGRNPAVFVLTYAAIANLFDEEASSASGGVQKFIETFGVQFVVLDEAHKVIDDLRGHTANVVRQLTDKLSNDQLRGLIGFSATLSIPKRRFQNVGLQLVYRIPLVELVSSGFVAPFAEFGVPYAFSAREQQIRLLLEEFRKLYRRFLAICDVDFVRSEYTRIPLEQRVLIIQRLMGMYADRPDGDDSVKMRLQQWEQLSSLSLNQTAILLIVQATTGASEFGFVPKKHWDELRKVLQQVHGLRTRMAEVCALDDVSAVVGARTKLGQKIPTDEVARLLRPKVSNERARREFRKLSASSLTGLYFGVRPWARHLGEGRIDAVKSIINAERHTRTVTGTIVFDESRSLHWGDKAVSAGFDGVGGMFAHLLGEPDVIPIAALSKEIYLPVNDENPFAPRIARYVHQHILLGEFADVIGNLLLSALAVDSETAARFRTRLQDYLTAWLSDHTQGDRSRDERSDPEGNRTKQPTWHGFVDTVIKPLRSEFAHLQPGIAKRVAAAMRTRLHRRNVNLKTMMIGFFDYMKIADQCLESHRAELKQANGTTRPFRIISIPQGRRRQLMYDLVARIVDAKELPFNVVIVSDWARSGWNVIKPNLLIDATATRDVIAWQQLRGRAMRSLQSWSIDCYHALMALRSDTNEKVLPETLGGEQANAGPRNVTQANTLSQEQLNLLADCLETSLAKRLQTDGVRVIPNDQRLDTAVQLIQRYNKVTHIYELLKASGSDPQVMFSVEQERLRRRDAIEEKHRGQLNVDLEAGALVNESVDSTLIYHQDPQNDSPQQLQAAIETCLADCDPIIIRAWLQVAFSQQLVSLAGAGS